MKIEDLDLSVRAYNSLKRVGIDTVEQIRERDAEEILHIRNLGKKCFDEIMEKINCIRDTEYSDLIRKLREDWTGSREEAARAIEDLQARLKEAEKYRKEADFAKALVDRIYREAKISVEHNLRMYGDWITIEIDKWMHGGEQNDR